MARYHYLIVGAGVTGAAFARAMADAGKICLVIDRRQHIGGNVYTESIKKINVHKYGPHIFHTDDKRVWQFVNQYAHFVNPEYAPMIQDQGKRTPFVVNLHTFEKYWGLSEPQKVMERCQSQYEAFRSSSRNDFEQYMVTVFGQDIYDRLFRNYVQKSAGKPGSELPCTHSAEIPVRFSYDNRYYQDQYQGVPANGYTDMIQNMLSGIEVRLGVDYLENKDEWDQLADCVLYTGSIDEYFGYQLGVLKYTNLEYQEQVLDTSNYQGTAVCIDPEAPCNRTIEHKWLSGSSNPHGKKTVISQEFTKPWSTGMDRYHAVNDEDSQKLYSQYRELAEKQEKVLFCGRLARYCDFSMAQAIQDALMLAQFIQKSEKPEKAPDMTCKEIQKYDLEMLERLDSFAKEHNITYFMAGGTLLGAVRHKGFIPWDDDVDLMIPRPDYNRLIREFKDDRYVISACETDDEYNTPFARMWDTTTTLKWKKTEEKTIGAFIDLFPIDGYPNSGKLSKLYTRILTRKRVRIQWTMRKNLNKGEKKFLFKYLVKKLSLHSANTYSKRMNKFVQRIPYGSTRFCGVTTTKVNLHKERNPLSCYQETVYLPFEHLMLPAPAGYETYLTHLYREYRRLPPVEARHSVHSFTIVANNDQGKPAKTRAYGSVHDDFLRDEALNIQDNLSRIFEI